ncbi:hypothetical protein FCH28_22255 [Streptomyces piniterrae]|uniref:Uncharacterized protein n=1 Tax=Streptomyces piniterrae TaxID=2571125 RepID=A0A4U0NBD8_9ACTN|nr:hypothetical protein [Streptomyces piniterrae]TJZ51210.1 hypothetical protein FCH28_22255 [Streptomyces piniterrae]
MSAAMSRPSAPKPRGLVSRLPWWALALPVVSFVFLLVLLISTPAEAGAVSASHGLAPLLEVLARIVGAAS